MTPHPIPTRGEGGGEGGPGHRDNPPTLSQNTKDRATGSAHPLRISLHFEHTAPPFAAHFVNTLVFPRRATHAACLPTGERTKGVCVGGGRGVGGPTTCAGPPTHPRSTKAGLLAPCVCEHLPTPDFHTFREIPRRSRRAARAGDLPAYEKPGEGRRGVRPPSLTRSPSHGKQRFQGTGPTTPPPSRP